MNIFTIESNSPTITPEGLLIPEYRAIWDSDKSKDKRIAINKLAYVYYSADYKSIYLSFTKILREERLGEDFMQDAKYKPDMLILAAIAKYEQLQQTPTMNFLKAARHAMQETENYFMNIDYSERDSRGNAVYKGTDVTKMLKDCAGIKDALDKLEEAVKKEQSNEGTARGGGVGGLYEYGIGDDDDDQD